MMMRSRADLDENAKLNPCRRRHINTEDGLVERGGTEINTKPEVDAYADKRTCEHAKHATLRRRQGARSRCRRQQRTGDDNASRSGALPKGRRTMCILDSSGNRSAVHRREVAHGTWTAAPSTR